MFATNTEVAGNLRASVQAQGGVSAFVLPIPTGLIVRNFSHALTNLPLGFYYYQVSAFNDFGETPACPEAFYQVVASSVGIALNWLPVIGATGYRVYGRTSGATKTLLATVTGGLTCLFQDPTTVISPATPPNGMLPTQNTTGHLIVEAGYAKLFVRVAPAASDLVSVHAALAATAANLFPGPTTNPPIIRNLVVDFSAGWDGGDVTVIGTDQFSDAPVTEVFIAVPLTTVVGVKIFRTVFSITKGTIGTTGTASVGVGDKLGIQGKLVDTLSALSFVDNAAEPATLDATYNGYLPTTLPNGAASYALLANVKE